MVEEDLQSLKLGAMGFGLFDATQCLELRREICQMSIVARETWGAKDDKSTN